MSMISELVEELIDNADSYTKELHDLMYRAAGAIEMLSEKARGQEWIPCEERLPSESGNYLVCPSDSVLADYSDFSDVMVMPYDADCEAFGWWTERFDPVSLGYVDSDFNEYEVVAWMPLPKPWKGADDE